MNARKTKLAELVDAKTLEAILPIFERAESAIICVFDDDGGFHHFIGRNCLIECLYASETPSPFAAFAQVDDWGNYRRVMMGVLKPGSDKFCIELEEEQ